MACEALTADPDFYTFSDVQRTGLFAATVFHDVGKVRITTERWKMGFSASFFYRKLDDKRVSLDGLRAMRQHG